MTTIKPIKKVLVANRGEIAVRILRTLREKSIESVAVYSDIDRNASHVLKADEAFRLGPAPSNQSYLKADKIIEACKFHGVDAVHPGYGFLSENDGFAETLESNGIRLIGPPAKAMRLMGSKTEARKAMEKAGVPVVPGHNGPNGEGFPTSELALKAALGIGFPVLIKAAAGGGGKGMRLVEKESDFAGAFNAAKREALSSFGDDTVYVEKAIIRPRHVEIQIFADNHGNVVHLGERDCSVQRRHQKVVEEAPSPAVNEELRQKMGASAVAAARSCDYSGAGTVEFLLSPDGHYYFLEMNTRLQVEHPVTEMIYAVDLVAWQVDVAEGKTLPYSQEELDARRRGWSMECRVYAEDPIKFLPSPGQIKKLEVPGGPFVRDDSGVYEGAFIPVEYDPLVSKLIVWGQNRNEARERMKRAIQEYVVIGIDTNLEFHKKLLEHPAFVSGEYDTGLISRESNLTDVGVVDESQKMSAGVVGVLDSQKKGHQENDPINKTTKKGFSLWRQHL